MICVFSATLPHYGAHLTNLQEASFHGIAAGLLPAEGYLRSLTRLEFVGTIPWSRRLQCWSNRQSCVEGRLSSPCDGRPGIPSGLRYIYDSQDAIGSLRSNLIGLSPSSNLSAWAAYLVFWGPRCSWARDTWR